MLPHQRGDLIFTIRLCFGHTDLEPSDVRAGVSASFRTASILDSQLAPSAACGLARPQNNKHSVKELVEMSQIKA